MLAFILLFGGWVAYEDIRYGKIRNRVLLLGVAVGLVFNLALALSARWGYNDFIEPGAEWKYLWVVGLDVLVSFLLGFCLWIFRFWAAGDAKLFAVLSLLLPLRFYHNNFLEYFQSFVLFFNTFLVLIVLLVLEFIWKLANRFVRERQWTQSSNLLSSLWKRISADPLGTLKVVVGLVALFLAVRLLRQFARDWLWAEFHFNKTLMYLILFIFLEPLQGFFRRRWVFLGAVAGLLSVTGWWAWQGQWNEILGLFQIGFFMIVLIVFSVVYDFYTDNFDVRLVPPVELHSGSIVSDRCLTGLKRREGFNNEALGTVEADGLNPRQVEVLTSWLRKNAPTEDVEVCNTVPFTPGMVLGTIATVLFSGYILVI
jgi:Flp pilus assembly protein protease CpaA